MQFRTAKRLQMQLRTTPSNRRLQSSKRKAVLNCMRLEKAVLNCMRLEEVGVWKSSLEDCNLRSVPNAVLNCNDLPF